MSNTLFDKPIDQLREAFVRKRFAERAHFGRADIEHWLRHQRESRHPDRSMEGFGRFGDLITRHAPHPLTAEHLPQYATPVRRSGRWQHWANGAGPNHKKIIVTLVNGGAKLYRSYDGGPVFVVDGSWFTANARSIRGFNESAFLDVVFSEWEYGTRKAGAAREFICGAMYKAITEVRQAAERDFNEAVAVSADGTRIVKACKVAVILDEDRLMLFPDSAFVDNKIFLSPNMTRHRDMVERPKEDYATWVLRSMTMWDKRRNGQVLDTSFTTQGDTCFITEQRFCPSPLPDGGRVIEAV